MNQVLDVLKQRRSVRAYQPRQVDEATLQLILEAGTYAPTGMGKQSPVMVAVQASETVALLSRLNANVMGTDTDPFYGAPTVVVVLADPERPTHIYDGSLVMGNLMNAAFSLGVDSCWIHRAREVFALPEGKALLRQWGLPENLVGIGHCILGYRKGDLPSPAPRKGKYITLIR